MSLFAVSKNHLLIYSISSLILKWLFLLCLDMYILLYICKRLFSHLTPGPATQLYLAVQLKPVQTSFHIEIQRNWALKAHRRAYYTNKIKKTQITAYSTCSVLFLSTKLFYSYQQASVLLRKENVTCTIVAPVQTEQNFPRTCFRHITR